MREEKKVRISELWRHSARHSTVREYLFLSSFSSSLNSYLSNYLSHLLFDLFATYLFLYYLPTYLFYLIWCCHNHWKDKWRVLLLSLYEREAMECMEGTYSCRVGCQERVAWNTNCNSSRYILWCCWAWWLVCMCSVKNRTVGFGKKRERKVRKREIVINQWSYSND